jgi:hypothetical protein
MLDFRRQPGRIMKALARNEPVTLVFRGRVAGVIQPAGPARVSGRTEDHASFGMWRHREDLADPGAFVRRLRTPRHRAL